MRDIYAVLEALKDGPSRLAGLPNKAISECLSSGLVKKVPDPKAQRKHTKVYSLKPGALASGPYTRVLRDHGPLTAVEISLLLGVSPSYVRRELTQLEFKGHATSVLELLPSRCLFEIVALPPGEWSLAKLSEQTGILVRYLLVHPQVMVSCCVVA